MLRGTFRGTFRGMYRSMFRSMFRGMFRRDEPLTKGTLWGMYRVCIGYVSRYVSGYVSGYVSAGSNTRPFMNS